MSLPTATLSVLVRSLAQLDAVLAWRAQDAQWPLLERVFCDFEDVRRYREAVARVTAARESAARDNPASSIPAIGLATLRIVKPGEEGLLKQIARAEADAILVRNLAAISYFREHAPQTPLIGDFSLNVANELTAAVFIESGLERIVPGFDLNWDQLAALATRCDAGWFEVVVHQHMPMFHMEHCVFAAMLSAGKDWRDCGRPCDHHRVELRDRAGSEFPLLADTGCRNTVFNSVPQSAAEFLPRMQTAGLRHFRVDLLREAGGEVHSLLNSYARILAGQEAPRQAWRQLQVLSQLGVTRGTLRAN